MKFKKLKKIKDLLLINNSHFEDKRGVLSRNFCSKNLKKLRFKVAQGNISYNKSKHTLRGFHYQKRKFKEKKIITAINGSIFNVVIDLRKNSKTFLKSEKIILKANNYQSLYVPDGCANAYLTLEKNTIIHYYMGNFYNKKYYSGFRFNDNFFNINWPFKPKVISKKDRSYSDFTLKNL